MKPLILLLAFLLTSCASIGLNVGSDTNNYINNGTLIINQTKTDTVTKYVDPYAEQWRNTYDNSSEIIGESMSSYVGADGSITVYGGQTMIDTSKYGKPYTFGVGIGGEGYLYSRERHFRAGLSPSLRWVFINESAYRTLHFIQLELGFKLSFGNMRNRGYLMTVLTTNIHSASSSSVPRYGKNPDDVNFSSEMFGIEFGFTHIWPSKHSADFFLRVDQTPFNYSNREKDITVCVFGIRYNV